MPIKKTNVIELPELKLSQIQIQLIGRTPLVVHQFSQKEKMKMLGVQTGKAKSGKEARDPEQEYRDSLYVKPDGKYGFPAVAFKCAVVNAANDAGMQKTMMRRAFHVIGDELLEIQGEPHMREDVVRIGMDVAMVRFRGEFTQWSVNVPIVYNQGIISLEQIVNLFRIAGFGVGVGEWRPEKNGVLGTWEVGTVTTME